MASSKRHSWRAVAAATALTATVAVAAGPVGRAEAAGPPPTLVPLASYDSGSGETGAEIVAYDARTGSMLVINGALNRIDIVSLADPAAPVLTGIVPLASEGSGVQSVATHDGRGVAAVAGATVLDPGQAVFFDIATATIYARVPTGVLPDAVTWSKDGETVVVSNEGEPRCVTGPDRVPTTDPTRAENPEGSVTVIDVDDDDDEPEARQVTFTRFNDQVDALRARGLRVATWPGSTVAQDIEPEYATIEGDKAYVTLQENDAVAVIDLKKAKVEALLPLGTKDHSLPADAIDASDRDAAFRPATWPVKGMFMPDSIASLRSRGRTYLLTANEGDTRAYFAGLANAEVAGLECFADEVRVRSLAGGLDPAAFGGAANVTLLRDNANLGRLKVSGVFPSVSGPTGYTSLASFGGRSMSVWTADGRLVWDSGSLFESVVHAQDPTHWVDDGGAPAPWSLARYDTRSDDKGPEPEGIAVGSHRGRTYAFVGLERAGGVMLFDVTDPTAPVHLAWVPVAGDTAPEGLSFVPASASPDGRPLLLAGNEGSGTTTVYALQT